jgi:Domain of unknown function (DUF5666)
MRGMALKLMILCSLLVATAFAVQFAVADNGGGETEIEIEAPLEAVNCAAVPPTVTLLGLTIDISQAKGEEGETLNCAALLVGELVEVRLAGDVPNSTTGLLIAVKLETEGEDCDDEDCVEIEAPIQAVDTVGSTITVLGLTIDISQAEIDGDEEEEQGKSHEGEDDHPHAPLTLIVGQFVEVKLASNQQPLIATEVEVKNSGTGIEVEIVDQNGDEIEDDDDDIQVVATVTPSTSGNKSGVKGGKKTLTFRAHSNGRVRLSGLPAGKAKLAITRIHNTGKSTGKASAVIQSQLTTRVVTRLKQGK